MVENNYRKAPPGFTKAQWEQFDREGILVIENALTQEEVDYYLDVNVIKLT